MCPINVDKIRIIPHNRLFLLGDENNLVYRSHSNQSSIIHTYFNENNMMGTQVPRLLNNVEHFGR